jgi:hypothetical protein
MQVWDNPNANNVLLEPLEKFQLNAARIVTGATARSKSDQLYKDTKWETLAKTIIGIRKCLRL